MSVRADLAADLELALAATREAGKAILPLFGREQSVRYKSPEQPVTQADLLADGILRERLTAARPDYGWLSEETADSAERLQARRVWIVDPIDGTTSFVAGYAEFAVSVALVEEGRPLLGVVFNPASDELYYAVGGGGAFRDGRPIRVSETGATEGAGVILASRAEIRRGDFAAFSAWRVRPLGSTSYKMVKVADGGGDLYFSLNRKSEWDLCAAALLVTEAGGVVTDLAGRPLRFNRRDPACRGVVASNGRLHGWILTRLDEPELQSLEEI